MADCTRSSSRGEIDVKTETTNHLDTNTTMKYSVYGVSHHPNAPVHLITHRKHGTLLHYLHQIIEGIIRGVNMSYMPTCILVHV